MGQVKRHGVDAQHVSPPAHQVEGVARRAVELVHEGDDGRPAHAAHVEELAGLGLHALGRVHDHDGAVRRGERAVGVLAEVVVTRRVEQVPVDAVVLELEHGGR
jgi:hypothetical protein